MTLQEKFKQWLDTDPRVQIRDVQLEVIAEEFAIGFAEWYLNLYESDDADTFCKNNMNQLLEIYKQQIK